MARLYDKSLELKHTGKDWMREVWGDCFDPSQAVWRLEFQLRRQILRECGLNDPDQVIEHRDQLWHYATQWLSLRDSQTVARRVRWPIADVWTQLAQSRVGPHISPLVRKRIKQHDESVLVRGLAGYASSLAAISGVSDLDARWICRWNPSFRLRGQHSDSPSRMVATDAEPSSRNGDTAEAGGVPGALELEH